MYPMMGGGGGLGPFQPLGGPGMMGTGGMGPMGPMGSGGLFFGPEGGVHDLHPQLPDIDDPLRLGGRRFGPGGNPMGGGGSGGFPGPGGNMFM